LIVVGLTLNWPGGGPVADPLNDTVKDGFEAFEAITKPPPYLPANGGANVTLNVALWPGVKVQGRLIPEMLKPVPTVAWETVAFRPPVFCTVPLSV
jgi:hypothetical protein